MRNGRTLVFLAVLLITGFVVGAHDRPVEAAGICGIPRIDCDTNHVEPAAKIVIPETQLTFSAVTTNNVNGTTHGFCPALPSDSSKFLNGSGLWSTPASGVTVPTGTGWRHVTSGAEDSVASTPTYSQVGADPAGAASSVEAELTAFQTTSGMSGYVTTATLTNYQTTAGMTNYQTTAGMAGYATTATLTNYQTTAGMTNYASVIHTHTVTDVSGAVSTSDSRLTDARTPTGNITVEAPLSLTTSVSTATSTSVGLASTPHVKLNIDGNAAHYLDGSGSWSTPAGGGGGSGGGRVAIALDANDVACWTLNEAVGATSFANSVSGGTALSSSGTLHAGNPGAFAGSSVFIPSSTARVYSNAGAYQPASALTASVWIKLLTGYPSQYTQGLTKTVNADTWAGNGRDIMVGGIFGTNHGSAWAAIVRSSYDNADHWLTVDMYAVPLYEWSFHAVTFTGTAATYYINGVAVASYTWGGSGTINYENNGRWVIGTPNGLSAPDVCSDTIFDDVRISNVARSAAYLLAQYKAGMGII